MQYYANYSMDVNFFRIAVLRGLFSVRSGISWFRLWNNTSIPTVGNGHKKCNKC